MLHRPGPGFRYARPRPLTKAMAHREIEAEWGADIHRHPTDYRTMSSAATSTAPLARFTSKFELQPMFPQLGDELHWRPAQWPAATEAELNRMIRDERKIPEKDRCRFVAYDLPVYETSTGMGPANGIPGVSQMCIITWHAICRCYTVIPPNRYGMSIRRAPTAADDGEDEDGEGDKLMEPADAPAP